MTGSRFRRKRSSFFAALLLLLTLTTLSQHNSKSIKDLENRKKKISEEINEISGMLSETKASKKSSLGVLTNLNVKLQKRQELIRTILAEIRVIDRDIAKTREDIDRQKQALAKLKREYARMIVHAQKNQDAYSVMMFVFSSDDFSQAYSRLKYIQQYSAFRRKQATEIIKTQDAITERLGDLTAQLKQKNELLGIEETEKKQLSSEKQEQEEVISSLQKKENDLKAELEKRKRDATELQLAIKRMIEAEIKRKAEEAAKAEAARIAAKKAEAVSKKKAGSKKKKPETESKVAEKNRKEKEDSGVPELNEEALALSEDFSNNRGRLPWPVQKGIICEGYGEHEHPAIKGFMMFNNGLEICATRGMQARAVFDGEVTGIAVSPTGGKLVIIRHGEYLSVYSNLEDIMVKTGQKVTVKQPIGVVKYDEDEGKTSMNLQIWKGQKTMDPAGWLSNAR